MPKKIIILSVVGLVAITLAGLGVYRFRIWRQRVRGEYYTAGVIRDVTKYVATHDGAWPTTWEDIGETKQAESFVTMRFDLTSEQILADTNLIFTSILPARGEYIMYPHGTWDLNHLLETIRNKGITNGSTVFSIPRAE